MLPERPPCGEDIVRDRELLRVKAKLGASRLDLVLAQRGAMRCRRALLVRSAEADDRLAADQRRPRIGLRFIDRPRNVVCIEAVALRDVPLRRDMACDDILVPRQIGRTVDRDLIVVPKDDQATELQVPGETDRLVIDAFHEATVAGDHIGPVIDQIIPIDGVEMTLGDRGSDGHRDALPQRPGRNLHSGKLEIFRVAGSRAVKLAEVPDIVECRALIAGQVEQSVDEHRSVARRKDEPVAVGPIGIGGIELQMAGEQRGRGVGHAHRHSRVTAVRSFDRIHRQGSNRVGKSA